MNKSSADKLGQEIASVVDDNGALKKTRSPRHSGRVPQQNRKGQGPQNDTSQKGGLTSRTRSTGGNTQSFSPDGGGPISFG